MPTPPAVVVDTLNSLLEAEQGSVVRFLGPSSPYLTRASTKLRDDIRAWVAANDERSRELAGMVDALGGVPAPRVIQPEEQFMAFLSLRFLLPKLVDAGQLLLERYDNALSLLDAPETPAGVVDRLRRLRDQHAEQLAAARRASDEVLSEKS
jgi:hypothetical protein